MSAEMIGIIITLLKEFLGNPLIAKMIDNWVSGTHNKVDDLVWDVVRHVLAIPHMSLAEKTAELKVQLEALQMQYSSLSDESRAELKATSRPAVLVTLDQIVYNA